MSVIDQIDSALQSGEERLHTMGRWGVTLAKVTNITDDDKLNRVKCVPIGSENITNAEGKTVSEETDWCYVMTPAGGASRGIFWFPQVDDLVALAYLDGDPHRPIVIGAVWTPEVSPPYTIEEGKVTEYSMKTPSAIELLMHDEEDKHKVTLTMPSGTVLILDDENKKVELRDQNSDNAFTIDWENGNISLASKQAMDFKAGGNITISSDGDIEIKAGGNSVKLEQSGNVTMKGSAKAVVDGANVEVTGSTGVAVKAPKTDVKADATLNLEGSAMTNLKGGIVKIN